VVLLMVVGELLECGVKVQQPTKGQMLEPAFAVRL